MVDVHSVVLHGNVLMIRKLDASPDKIEMKGGANWDPNE